MAAPETSEWVWLARIRRPQGHKGEVFADILTDFPEKFAERTHLWLLAPEGSPSTKSAPSAGGIPPIKGAPSMEQPYRSMGRLEVELTAHWLHKGGIVLHFSGIDSISAAETLAGKIVAIPRAQRAPLGQDEVHIADLALPFLEAPRLS